MPKMVKIGPAGPARQGVKWEGQLGLFFYLFFFIEFLARLWRPQFCTDRHRFCVRWRVLVGIDFL